MSKTISRSNAEIASTKEAVDLLDKAKLPGVSTIRFSRSLNSIQKQIQQVRENIGEIEDNFIKRDDEGDPVVEVRLRSGEKIGESAVVEETNQMGRTEITEYKDLDFEEIDYSEYEINEEDFDGQPPVTENYVIEDQSQMMKEKDKMLQDSVDIEIHEFPEEELEDVLLAFKKQNIQSKVNQISEVLSLSEDEKKKVEEVLEPSEKDTRMKPSEIQPIEFLFPEDI